MLELRVDVHGVDVRVALEDRGIVGVDERRDVRVRISCAQRGE